MSDFESFSISFSSQGVEEEDFTAANIKSNSLNLHSGKLVQKILDEVDYKKASE